MNAIQAMDGRGKVTVLTSTRRIVRRLPTTTEPGNPASRRSLPEEMEQIEVSVRDTGPGSGLRCFCNLFVPPFTTKTKGTGLGLALSQSIVQNAGGTIEVQSQPGMGTRFTIVLPAGDDAIVTPGPSASQAEPVSRVWPPRERIQG